MRYCGSMSSIYTLKQEPLSLPNRTQFAVHLKSNGRCQLQAGTYIKEFVHGDEGRTEPNLGSFLGCKEPAAILQLDVLEIHMDFL